MYCFSLEFCEILFVEAKKEQSATWHYVNMGKKTLIHKYIQHTNLVRGLSETSFVTRILQKVLPSPSTLTFQLFVPITFNHRQLAFQEHKRLDADPLKTTAGGG